MTFIGVIVWISLKGYFKNLYKKFNESKLS